MQRQISFSSDGRDKIKVGIDKAVDAIKVTFGGAGRNVIIEKMIGWPTITKDGVTVAKSIELPDRVENMGAMLVKEVATKTVDIAGDGTTVSSIFTQVIITLGMRAIEYDRVNPMDLKRGIEKAVVEVVSRLKTFSDPADTSERLKQIATISANNDVEIGSIISRAIEKVGRDGVVEVEESKSNETTIDIVDGLQFDKGFISPYFINHEGKPICELENPLILLWDKKISNMKEFVPVMSSIAKTGMSLLIICEDLDNEVLKNLIINKTQNGFKVCAVKLPTFGGAKKLVMEDIAIITDGEFFSEEKGNVFKRIDAAQLGKAEKVIITKSKTTIIGGRGSKFKIDERIIQIKIEIEDVNTSEFEKGKLKERLAKLQNGVAVIKVGGATETEISEKKYRIDDSKCATLASIDEGFVAGGGVTFIKCAQYLDTFAGSNAGENKGIDIIAEALEMPFKQILLNAGIEWVTRKRWQKSINVIDRIKSSEYGYGVNVKTGKYENLLANGIIDPVKVLRVALENASSVAAIFLTTECVIANID